MKQRLTWYQTDESSLEVTQQQGRRSILLKRNCHGGKPPRETIVISPLILNLSAENTTKIAHSGQRGNSK